MSAAITTGVAGPMAAAADGVVAGGGAAAGAGEEGRT